MAKMASLSTGHAVWAQGPKLRLVRATHATSAAGSIHSIVPARPKCPNVRSGPMWVLCAPDFEAEAPGIGLLPAVARQDAVKLIEVGPSGSGDCLVAQQGRSHDLTAEHEQIVDARSCPVRRGPGKVRRGEAEGFGNRFVEVLGA